MKLLVVSDNHRDQKALDWVLRNEIFDASIHLGDSEMSEEYIKKNFTYYVEGNCDHFYTGDKMINIEGLNIFMCHGHSLNISPENIVEPVRKFTNVNKTDLFLFGHIHRYTNIDVNSTKVICPGGINRPRGAEGKGYCIITINNSKIENIEFKEYHE